jgi:hypothetical protein
MWQLLRTIVEDHEVVNAANEFSSQYHRFNDAYDALKWLLARKSNPTWSEKQYRWGENLLVICAGERHSSENSSYRGRLYI